MRPVYRADQGAIKTGSVKKESMNWKHRDAVAVDAGKWCVVAPGFHLGVRIWLGKSFCFSDG